MDDMMDSFVTFSLDASIIRIADNTFIPSIIVVEAGIAREEEATEDDIEFALNKCRYFFDNVVSNSFVFAIFNTAALAILISDDGLNRSRNNFIFLPDEPSNEALATVFQAKLNALAKGAFVVETIRIEANDQSNLSFTLTGDHSSLLPVDMADWLGSPNYFDYPWWHRDDASTLDVTPTEHADLTKIPAWAYSFDFLRRDEQLVEHVGVVVRPEFNPVVIKGGKDDKK